MELPILLAADTTANWDKSDAVLGESELAIEYAGPPGKEKSVKYLLVGDGRPVTSQIEHLRAGPELIASLPGRITTEISAREQGDELLSGRITTEISAREQGDELLDRKIDSETSNRMNDIHGFAKDINAIKKELHQTSESMQVQLSEYRVVVDYMIYLVETIIGPMNGSMPLCTESGEYLATESGDYIVTA